MTFVRSCETMGTYTIGMNDMMDFDLEAKIIKAVQDMNMNSISFQYGHAQGARSEWYQGMLANYNPQFLGNMNATFSLTGICSSEAEKVISKTYDSAKYDNRVSNIIKAVVKEEGWKIQEPFVTSDKLEKPEKFSRINMSTMTFIRNNLIPRCNKSNNPTRLMYSNTTKGTFVKLVEIDVTKNNKIPTREYNFVINSGNYGSVLNFQPSYSGSAIAAMRVSAGYVDRETNQFMLFKNNPGLGKLTRNNPKVQGATSPKAFNDIIQNQWFKENLAGYTATLDIIGDPYINPMDYINIIPLRPDGRIHHSGGTYMVGTVTDTIDGGLYKTNLTLNKIPGEVASLSDTYASGWKK